jgi:hypothetical protein
MNVRYKKVSHLAGEPLWYLVKDREMKDHQSGNQLPKDHFYRINVQHQVNLILLKTPYEMLFDALLSISNRILPEDHLSIANLPEQGRSVAGSSATSFPCPDARLCIDDSHL